VQILYDIVICEESASECLSYARTAPNIVQISAFLVSKDGLSSLNFENHAADFQMSPSDIEIKFNIFLANLKF
jgi:hypothetical protein